jgi:glycosyltransferase involved in cell wall biosynthesis
VFINGPSHQSLDPVDLSRLDVCLIAGILGSGGAEQQLYYIAKALMESGTRTRLLYMTAGNWEERFRTLGIPVVHIGDQGPRAARLGRILGHLRTCRPHIIQSQHFYTNLYAAMAARALGVREVGALRNDAISEVRQCGRPLGWLSLRLPRVIAANSRGAIQNAVAMGVAPRRLCFLPNVVDTDRFSPVRSSPNGAVRIVVPARLSPQKRIDRFLRALARVKAQSRVKVQGVIVGHDPDNQWPAIKEQGLALGIAPGELEFLGPLPDITRVYREADLLALTSDWEGTPNVVLEGMAAALPVVATRVGGVPDLVRHGRTGFLVTPGDDDALVDSLRQLIESPQLRDRMGRQGRDHVLATHSLQRLPSSLAHLYAGTLSS